MTATTLSSLRQRLSRMLVASLVAGVLPLAAAQLVDAAPRPSGVLADGTCSDPDYTRLGIGDPAGLGREAVCVAGRPSFLTKGLPVNKVRTSSTPFERLPGSCPSRFLEEARRRELDRAHRAGDPVYFSCGAYAANASRLGGDAIATGLPGQYGYFAHNNQYRPQVHNNSLASVKVRFMNRSTGRYQYFTSTVKDEACAYFHHCQLELTAASVEGFTAFLPTRAICTEAANRLLATMGDGFARSWYHNFSAPAGTADRSPCYATGDSHYNEYQYAVWTLVSIDCSSVNCGTTTTTTTTTGGPTTTTTTGGPTTPTTTPGGAVPSDGGNPCTPGTPGCLAPCLPSTPGCVDPCPGGTCPPPPDFCAENPGGLSCTPFDASGVAYEVVIEHPAQYAAKGSFLAQGARVRSTSLLCDSRTCNPGPGNLDPSRVSLTGRLTLTASRSSYKRCARVGESGCAYLPVTTDRDDAISVGDAVRSFFFSPTRTNEAVNVYLASTRGRVQTYRWEPIYERVEVACADGSPGCFESVFTGEYRRVRDRVITVPIVVRNTSGQVLPPAGVFLRVIGSVGG